MPTVVMKGSDVTINIGGAVAQVTGGSLSESRDTIDITNLDSTRKEILVDPLTKEGTCSIDFYANASHVTMLNTIDDTTVQACTITCAETDGTGGITGAFNAYVTNVEISGFAVGGAVAGKVELVLDSDVTWT